MNISILLKKITVIVLIFSVLLFSIPTVGANDIMFEEDAVSKEGFVINDLSIDKLPKQIFNSTQFDKIEDEKKPIALDTSDADILESFTTINADDSRTLYIFNQPIKYIEEDTKEIKFIDNSIEKVDNKIFGESAYTNKSNSFEVYFPSNIKEGINFDNKEFKLSMVPCSDVEASPKKVEVDFYGTKQEFLEYKNVFGAGTHLQYSSTNTGFKENIVLEKYNGFNEFEFIIEIENYIPAYTSGESIPFIDPETEEIKFIIGQIDVYDLNNTASEIGSVLNNSISLVSMENSKYKLKITVDKEFLEKDTTVYPVVVDPTITIYNVSLSDTTVYSSVPNTQTYYTDAYNYAGDRGLYGRGVTYVQPTVMNYYRYINPDNVYEAYYHVREVSGNSTVTNISLKESIQIWNEDTITYNTQPNLSATVTTKEIDSSGWYDFEITQLVRKWIKYTRSDGGIPQRCGFALQYESGSVAGKKFCSANYSGDFAPSIVLSYYNDAIRILSYVDGFGELPVRTRITYSFDVATTGTYDLRTMQPNAPYGSIGDTVLKLYNSDYLKIAESDDISEDNHYSRIYRTLSPGTYYIKIYEHYDIPSSVPCYFVIERNNELYAPPSTYANMIYDFYKLGDSSNSYNCLAYALGYEDRVIEVFFELSVVTSYMASHGYVKVNSLTENCIIAYGFDNKVTHYAKVTNNVITAKLGRLEKVRHMSQNAYYISSIYGTPMAYYVKQ